MFRREARSGKLSSKVNSRFAQGDFALEGTSLEVKIKVKVKGVPNGLGVVGSEQI